MSNLIAKTIVKDQYWIVTDGDKKVGNVLANSTYYANTTAIKRKTKIEFQQANKQKPVPPISSFPTPTKTYNNVLDLKRKLHIFTKTAKSKCYYAAGWYVLNQGEPEVTFCPKYIFVQRYEYQGPFKTELEAKNVLNTR
jgi:beta-lactam-binding protein with PASTA domain